MFKKQVEFCHKVSELKYLKRYSNNPLVTNKDTVASHTWRVAILALTIRKELEELGIDFVKLISLILVHDLVELGNSEVKALGYRDREKKSQIERRNAKKLFKKYLGTGFGEEVLSLVKEVLDTSSGEALITKTLDNYESNMHVIEEIAPLKDLGQRRRTKEYITKRLGINEVTDRLIETQLLEIDGIE